MSSVIKKSEKDKSFRRELIERLVTLSTSGFGLVAALAWNEAIQQAVKDFIEPRIPGSGLFSKMIYAVIITLFAVLITYQLSKLASKWGAKGRSP